LRGARCWRVRAERAMGLRLGQTYPDGYRITRWSRRHRVRLSRAVSPKGIPTKGNEIWYAPTGMWCPYRAQQTQSPMSGVGWPGVF